MFRCTSALLSVGWLVAMGSAVQADQSSPSQTMLRAMGLSGIQVMSDSEALAVRGRGYSHGNSYNYGGAVAYGSSYANVRTHGASAGSKDGFYAQGRYKAAGEHGSFAGVVIRRGQGGHPGGGGGGNYGGGEGARWGGGGGDYRPPHRSAAKKVVAFSGGFARATVK